jgi:hypothetical protein
MFSEDFARLVAKLFGPFILFIGFPGVAWMVYDVTRKDMARGIHVSNKLNFENTLLVLLIGLGGFYLCRYGYGWFGGKKKGHTNG